jgi:hypothetical protein
MKARIVFIAISLIGAVAMAHGETARDETLFTELNAEVQSKLEAQIAESLATTLDQPVIVAPLTVVEVVELAAAHEINSRG